MYQYILTVFMLAVCACTDIRSGKVKKATILCYAVLIFAGHLVQRSSPVSGILAGLLPGCFCLLLSRGTRQALGYGDSLLIAACGASLGFWSCVTLLCTAFFLAGIWAGILFLFRKADRKDSFPFVPFLLAASLLQGFG